MRFFGIAALFLAMTAAGVDLDVSPIGQWPTGNSELSVRDVALRGENAFLVTGFGFNGLQILDVSNPRQPQFVSQYALTGSLHRIALAGDYAYLIGYTNNNGLLHVVSVTNVASPVLLGTAVLSAYPREIAAADGFVYITTGAFVSIPTSGFQVYDVRNPYAPTRAGTIVFSAHTAHLAVRDGFVYLCDAIAAGLFPRRRVNTVEVSDPANPRIVDTDEVSKDQNDPVSQPFGFAGQYMYNGAYIFDLRILPRPCWSATTWAASLTHAIISRWEAAMSLISPILDGQNASDVTVWLA